MTAVCWRCNGAGYVRRHSTNALLLDVCDVCDTTGEQPTDDDLDAVAPEVNPDYPDHLAKDQT